MTVTTLASISLLALVVTAAPLPSPNDASQVQTPKCSGCEQGSEPSIRLASVEEPHDVLPNLADVDAGKDLLSIDFADSPQDENVPEEVQDVSTPAEILDAAERVSADVESSIEVAATPASDVSNGVVVVKPKFPALSPRQITYNLTCVTLGVTVGCIFGLLYLKYMLGSSKRTVPDIEAASDSKIPGSLDDEEISSYGDEKKQLVVVDSQSSHPDMDSCSDEEKRALRAEYAPSEADDSSDEDLDEKFVDAEEPPVLLIDTSVPPVPEIVVQQHPDPELLPLPTARPSTPFCTPPPTLAAPSEDGRYIDPTLWKNAREWDPSRWSDPESFAQQAYKQYDDAEGAKVDFGFGLFAYLQLSTVISTLIRQVELKLGPEGFPSPDYTTMITLPKAPRNIMYRRRKFD
ncbi:hypothetical protein NM688_g218 [Phlebia brevispora]|uniref:Uncharacterized protein n=1 Tax=Phlebia brevispora TaxID=194682 RepID=A0ACC1TEM1_9APHY|nr:hypothetical protein NM688_g218 [Phlebia brevispora]